VFHERQHASSSAHHQDIVFSRLDHVLNWVARFETVTYLEKTIYFETIFPF
jgi:hypothetical protein